MSTPQNPGDGETPQDPSDPQNPYGTPPPPPSTPPPPPPPSDPAPPTTPIPAAPAPGGDPSVPPGAPAAPPPYGEQPAVSATPPYGQPGQPGQPPYAAPGYSPMPGPAEPSKGMAITALIMSILGCTCIGALVAIPLAIVVLVRSKDGRNHGKGLAIAAIIISVISLISVAIGGYFLYDYAKDLKDVDDLKAGQCITANGLTDESETGVTQIKSVGCTDQARRRGSVHGVADRRRGGQLRRDLARGHLHPVGDRGRQHRPSVRPRAGPDRPDPGLVAGVRRQAGLRDRERGWVEADLQARILNRCGEPS